MKKVVFSILNLLIPSFIFSICLYCFNSMNPETSILYFYFVLYLITLIWIIAAVISDFCDFRFILLGIFFSTLSAIPVFIIANIQKGYLPLLEIGYAILVIIFCFVLYTLPSATIAIIVFLVHKKIKSATKNHERINHKN